MQRQGRPLVFPARAPLHDARQQGGRRGAGAGGHRRPEAQRASRRRRARLRREHRRDRARAAAGARRRPARRKRQSLVLSHVPRRAAATRSAGLSTTWAIGSGTSRACASCWRKSCRRAPRSTTSRSSTTSSNWAAAPCCSTPGASTTRSERASGSCWPSRTSPSAGEEERGAQGADELQQRAKEPLRESEQRFSRLMQQLRAWSGSRARRARRLRQ